MAIKILEQRDMHGVPCGSSGGISEAVDLAIKALELTEKLEELLSRNKGHLMADWYIKKELGMEVEE